MRFLALLSTLQNTYFGTPEDGKYLATAGLFSDVLTRQHFMYSVVMDVDEVHKILD